MNFHNCFVKIENSILVLSRKFSISNNLHVKQEHRVMKKLLYGSSAKKKKYNLSDNKSPLLPTTASLTKGAFEGKKSINSKRIAILNKLFMKNITDLMATGEYSNEFIGKGLEISRVQTTPDFQGVNVFWLAKGSEDDDKLQETLNKHSGSLRHELSQLRVMGIVPKIHFVKDKQYAKLVEVDVRLMNADFGDDYVPVDPSYRMKTEFMLNSKLSDDVKERIKIVEDETKEEIDEEPLPPMRQDIFGLNHADLMANVKRQIKKSKALHRKLPNMEAPENEDKTEGENMPARAFAYSSMRAQKMAFEKFLQQRQILKMKAQRERDKNYSPDTEYLREQFSFVDNDDITDIKDDDFIEEFDEKTAKR